MNGVLAFLISHNGSSLWSSNGSWDAVIEMDCTNLMGMMASSSCANRRSKTAGLQG